MRHQKCLTIKQKNAQMREVKTTGKLAQPKSLWRAGPDRKYYFLVLCWLGWLVYGPITKIVMGVMGTKVLRFKCDYVNKRVHYMGLPSIQLPVLEFYNPSSSEGNQPPALSVTLRPIDISDKCQNSLMLFIVCKRLFSFFSC